jgi:hypothetical protein
MSMNLKADIIRLEPIVLSQDRTGLQRTERMSEYDQRIAGERTVRFMCGEECLKQITMDEFLRITGRGVRNA